MCEKLTFVTESKRTMNSSTNRRPVAKAAITLRVNCDTKKVERYKMLPGDMHIAKPVDATQIKLSDLVERITFQDNSLCFDPIMKNDKNFVLCVFPPGCGKTTTLKLLKHYVSVETPPKSIQDYFEKSELYKKELERKISKSDYKMIRSSTTNIFYLDTANVTGSSRSELQRSFSLHLQYCWKSTQLPADCINDEIEFLQNDNMAWSSLGRLKQIARLHGQALLILIDGLDVLYNRIACLDKDDSEELCSRFTTNIRTLTDINDEDIKVIAFGVSPYLITEFQSLAKCYSIDCEEDDFNSVGTFFSYWDATMEKVIKQWNLPINVDDCKEAAKFSYGKNQFINPYIAISYMTSMKNASSCFKLNIEPKSLWLKSIFDENDLRLLIGVLKGQCVREFSMSISISNMCTIYHDARTRKIFYPLFVYGGFLTCVGNNGTVESERSNDESLEEEEEQEASYYVLTVSNDTMRVTLKRQLENLYRAKFKQGFSESESAFKDYIDGNYIEFCKKIQTCIGSVSSHLLSEERVYHNMMVGIFSLAECNGYIVQHDKEIAGVKPDTIIINDKISCIFEYKRIADQQRCGIKDVRQDLSYTGQIQNYTKTQIVGKVKTSVQECCLNQVSRYGHVLASTVQKDIEINLMIFYLSNVVLLRCKYSLAEASTSPYIIYATPGFFTNNDLDEICKATLI